MENKLFTSKITSLLNDYKNGSDKIVQETIEDYKRIQEELDKCNILIIGKTGVGKSTLVNSIFAEELAETGTGRPVTDHISKYDRDGCPITVYDTAGLEISKEENTSREVDFPSAPIQRGDIEKVKKDVLDVITRCKQDEKEQIHLIWYCVNFLSNRLEEGEEHWIREIKDLDIPIVLVLTQTVFPKNRTFFNYLESLELPIREIISVVAEPYEIDDENTVSSFGLEDLIEISADCLVDRIREVFIEQQIVNIEIIEKEALKYVIGYSALAGAAGMSPVPGSDTLLIFQSQTKMAAKIFHLFGITPDKEFLDQIIKTVAGASGTVLTGIVGNCLKAVPGIGTLTGEALSAISASTLTGAFGTSLVRTLKAFRTKQLQNHNLTEEDKTILINTFLEEYQNYVNGRI